MAKFNLEKPGMHRDAQPELFKFARLNRENPTPAEALLWEALRDKKLDGYKFRRQHPVGAYILDFYCHASRLVIEIDGGYHHTKEQVDYDMERTAQLKKMGLQEVRFSNEEITDNLEDVIKKIRSCLTCAPTPTPDP